MSEQKYAMIPVPGYVTLHDEPAFMIGMMGMEVSAEEAPVIAGQMGLYDKSRRASHDGHWYSVAGPGFESYSYRVGGDERVDRFKRGQFVVADLDARDHLLDLAGDRMCLLASKHIIGVLDLGDEENGMRFDTVGYWVLVKQDDDVAARLAGAQSIILPGKSLDLGIRSSEQIGMVPLEDGSMHDPGVRVKYARVVDAGKLAECKPGDVVCYQSSGGEVPVAIAGERYTALAAGSVLGVLSSDQFPPWVAPEQKTA